MDTDQALETNPVRLCVCYHSNMCDSFIDSLRLRMKIYDNVSHNAMSFVGRKASRVDGFRRLVLVTTNSFAISATSETCSLLYPQKCAKRRVLHRTQPPLSTFLALQDRAQILEKQLEMELCERDLFLSRKTWKISTSLLSVSF